MVVNSYLVFQTKYVPRMLFSLVLDDLQDKIDEKGRTSHPLMIHVSDNKKILCATETERILCLVFNRGA